jgi:hypothetical protein
MRWYLPLFSAALEAPAFTFGPEQKAKKYAFKYSNFIAGRISRARRRRQRLPSSLLIENASDRQRKNFASDFAPGRFRSSLTTNRK